MKQTVTAPLQNEIKAPLFASSLAHTAVHPAPQQAVAIPAHAVGQQPAFGRDFSQATVQAPAAMVGRDYGSVACPVFPRTCPFGGACHTCSARVQAKLTIGQPGDKYEQEADRVADIVMQMPDPAVQRRGTAPGIQRACPACEDELRRQPEEEEEEGLEAKSLPSHELQVGPNVESRLRDLRSGGGPLSESARAFFEPRFRHDLGQVRVDSDGPAAAIAKEINAEAFALGHHVFFGAGRYVPETSSGRKLLAHELTHVIQQEGAFGIMRSTGAGDESAFIASSPEQSVRIPRWIVDLTEGDRTAAAEETTPVAARSSPVVARRKPVIGMDCGHFIQCNPTKILRVTGPATGNCSWTCRPGTAPEYTAVSATSYNCYAYALNSPDRGRLQPGQIANTLEFRALSGDPAAIAGLGGPVAAARHLRTNYFSPGGMRRQFTADLGSPTSSGCMGCCSPTKRKIIAVTTGPVASVGYLQWDFHWYRKDADRAWSHKPGETPSTRNDARDKGPICSPCRVSRSRPVNYSHVVGAWCL